MARYGLSFWAAGVLAAAVGLLAAAPARALVEHPNTPEYPDSEGTPPDKPPDAVVGRWSYNASAVAIAPNDAPPGYQTQYFITTRHQGGGMGATVNFGGTDYLAGDLFVHPTADLRIGLVTDLSGQPAYLGNWAACYTATDETSQGSPAVIGGFGKSRGTAYPNYYTWAGSDNLTLRWGRNALVTSDRVAANTWFGETYTSDVLIAYFDDYTSAGRVAYEAAVAEYDSGGGWFLPVGGEWKLAAVSAYAEHAAAGQSWFKGNPLPGEGDALAPIRISSYANWIDGVLKRSTWNLPAGGLWADAGNWSAGVPNAKDGWAVFSDSVAGARTVTVGANTKLGTLRFDAAGDVVIAATGGGNLEFTVTIDSAVLEVFARQGSGALTISAPVKLSSPLLVNHNSGGLLTISGAISGARSLTKSGSGTLVLASANSYSGGTRINQGTLRVTAAGALGFIGTTVALAGGTLDVRSDTSVTYANNLRASASSGINVDRASSGSNRTVTFSALTTEGELTLTITGANGYGLAVSGATSITNLPTAGTLTVNTAGADVKFSGGVTLGVGTLAKTGPKTLTLQGTQTYGAGTGLRVSQGALVLANDAGSASKYNLSVTAGNTGQVQFGATQHLAALNLDAGSAALMPGGSKVLLTKGLSLDATDSRLDLADGAMVLVYTGSSPLAQIQGWVASGANFSSGFWNGYGITSTTAAADPDYLHAVGVMANDYGGAPIYTQFHGVAVDATSILLALTYFGDADLDGDVTPLDYNLIDTNWNTGGTLGGWVNGDFDYDGALTPLDYNLIDTVYNVLHGGGGAGSLHGLIAQESGWPGASDASWSDAPAVPVAPVPDVSTLMLLTVGIARLLGRAGPRGRSAPVHGYDADFGRVNLSDVRSVARGAVSAMTRGA